MRRLGRGWDLCFFLAVVNCLHGTADVQERVMPLVTPAISTRSSSLAFLLAALTDAFFYFVRATERLREHYLF